MALINIKPYYILNISASIIMQIVALIIVYLLTPEEYGYYSLLTSIAQIMFILCSGWTNAAVINLGTKSYAETGTYKNIIVYRAIIVIISWLLISSIFLLFRSFFEDFVVNKSLYWYIYLLFIGQVFYDFSYQLLYPGNKNTIQAGLMLFVNIIILVCVIGIVQDVKSYVLVNSAVQTLLFIIVIYLFLKYYKQDKLVLKRKEFNFVFKYCLWQLFGVIGIYFINLGTNYVLRFYSVDVADIGMYNFAYKLFCGFVPFYALIGIVLPKWLNDKNIVDKDMYIKQQMGKLLLLLFVLYIFFYFLLSPFLTLIHKEDYQKSTLLYMLLLPAFVFNSINQILHCIVVNTKFYKYGQYIAITQGLILVLVNIVFVGLWGIKGAIVGNTLSFLSATVLLYYIYISKVKSLLV